MEHRTMVEGTLHAVTGGSVLKDGTAYGVELGRGLVDGTVYEVGFGSLMLTQEAYNDRPGAKITTEITQSRLYAKVSGGSGANYTGVKWKLTKNGGLYQLKPGDRISMSFTGTTASGYCEYGAYLFTDPAEPWNSYVKKKVNGTGNDTWTVTVPCYFMFQVQIGGSTATSLSASQSVTKFTVNGETVWVRLG